MKKRIIAVVLALVLSFAFASVALATTDTVAVNFKNYVNTSKSYKANSDGTLWHTAYAAVYATQDSATALTGSAYNQTFKVTALSSSKNASFGTAYQWSAKNCTISGLTAGTSYTCQYGNQEAIYYIKGQVVVTYA